jgi:hypothetical protein
VGELMTETLRKFRVSMVDQEATEFESRCLADSVEIPVLI